MTSPAHLNCLCLCAGAARWLPALPPCCGGCAAAGSLRQADPDSQQQLAASWRHLAQAAADGVRPCLVCRCHNQRRAGPQVPASLHVLHHAWPVTSRGHTCCFMGWAWPSLMFSAGHSCDSPCTRKRRVTLEVPMAAQLPPYIVLQLLATRPTSQGHDLGAAVLHHQQSSAPSGAWRTGPLPFGRAWDARACILPGAAGGALIWAGWACR